MHRATKDCGSRRELLQLRPEHLAPGVSAVVLPQRPALDTGAVHPSRRPLYYQQPLETRLYGMKEKLLKQM